MMGFNNNDSNESSSTSDYNNENLDISLSSQRLTPYSPYLNFDPAFLPTNQPEFITSDGLVITDGAGRSRGRFELAFGQIGASCMIGAGIGGMRGFYRGLKATTMEGQTGKLRRTQLLNHVMKNGSSVANTLGVVCVMYSGIGVGLQLIRDTDDSINTMIAATCTGMLFKSTAGLPKCLMGGGVGLALASMYCLWNCRDSLTQLRHHNMNPA
ncbi:translocase of inner mitochondrial membrane 23 isoform X1 [Cotesia typhae]|uniref:translocase of inner mitochondrial membrane 23 isoform X1 n=1 Tax=Cotesia typhae TaxID=2053667 RepID=UPI003D68F677